MRQHNLFLILLYLLFIFYSTNVLGYSLSLPETPYSFTSADFNHDGENDIAVGFNGVVVILWGNNLGQFSLENVKYILFNGRADRLVSADVNSDGWVDLIVSDRIKNRLKVLVNLGADFVLHDEVNSFAPNIMVTGYINDDNYLDIVVPNPGGGIGVFYGKGNYKLNSKTWFTYEMMGGVYNIFNNIKLQDVDSDGTPEILGLSGNNIYVLKNNNNNLSVISTMQTGSTPSDIACADFNHDNIIDLVISNNLSNSVMIYYGLSEGGNISFNSQPVIYNVGLSPTSLIVGDFNNDSYLDIVVLCAASNEIYFLLSTGFGNFTIASCVLSLTQRPSAFLANDFNINGKFDIATISEEDNSLSVFLDNEINNTLNFKIPSIDVKVGVNNGEPSDGPITIDMNSIQSFQVYLSVNANDMHGYLADLYLELEVLEYSQGETLNVTHYSISDTGISNAENPFVSNWHIVNLPLSAVYNISTWDLLGAIGHSPSLDIKAKLVIKQNSSLPLMHIYTSDSVKVQFFAPSMINMPVLNLDTQIVSTNSIQAIASLIANDAEGLPTDVYMWVDCEYTKTEQTENNQTAIKYCVYYQKYENGSWNISEECSEDSYPIIEINPLISNWPLTSIPNPVPLFEFPLSIYQGRNSCNVNLKLVIHQLNGLTSTIWKQAPIP